MIFEIDVRNNCNDWKFSIIVIYCKIIKYNKSRILKGFYLIEKRRNYENFF